MSLQQRRMCPLQFCHLSERLKSDKDVALAFCKLDARNLEDVPSNLLDQEHEQFATLCKQDVLAVFCLQPCEMISELVSSMEFVLEVFRKGRSNDDTYPGDLDELFRRLPT